MSTELVLNPRIAQWTVEAFTRLLATYGVILGVFVLLSDEKRFSAPQYMTTLQLPGFPESWGGVMLVLGAAILIGSLTRRCSWVEYAGYGAAAWEIFFTLSVLDAVVAAPEASPTAFIIHGFVAIAFLLSAITYRQSRKA